MAGVTNKSEVARIFESMEYGPAPESDGPAQKWLEAHDRKFGHFINGAWYHPEGRSYYTTKSPMNKQVICDTIQGNEDDVNVAVDAAKTAQKSWAALSPHVRARHLYAIARAVQKHSRLIAVMESLDNGKPIRETRDCDIPLVARHFYHHAGWAQLMDDEMADWKPVGVIGGIVPWNFPLMLLTWKVAPALAMGNAVVLKPATYTRMSALLLAEICAEAGLPPGVFNVVTGKGSFGTLLAKHHDVDKVAFTGSTYVGQILRRATAGTGKKLSLELGGKSPVIIFDDCDLDAAVEGIVDAVWFNQGQVCSAGSRLLIQETIFEKAIGKIKERLSHFRVGNSLDKAIDMAALVDESQYTTIEEYVQSARDEGGDVFQPDIDLPVGGYYYKPTLITNVSTVSRVVQEEIFGPVAVAMSFRTSKEAIALGNNTCYGLGSSVWSDSLPKALEVAITLKAGAVWVNSHNLFDAAAGFGGYKESGFGRDGGKEGLYEYVKPKWQSPLKIDVPDFDIKKFGATYGGTDGAPIPGSGDTKSTLVNGVPSIDRTYKLYYAGAQKRPDGNYCRPVKDTDGKILAYIGEANRKDVRNAVEAAHKAAPGWGKRAAHNRAQIVYFMAENLELRRSEFAQNMADVTGRKLEDCLNEVDLSIRRLFYWGAYADKFGGQVQETNLYGATVCIREPIGVVAIACPDEYPLLSFVSLFAPAIVRSNAIIIVPSQKCPIAALDFYQVFETSDLPGGVVNILTGDRDHIFKYLVEHQDIQAAWYFGSAQGSKFVEHTSAENIKRTWVNYGLARDWTDDKQGQGGEFLYHSTQCKNIWMPMGTTFAN